MPRLFDDETRARALTMKAWGLGVVAIARELGTSRQTVATWLKCRPLSRKSPTVTLTPEQVEEIRSLFALGEMNQPELASRFGTSQGAISRIIRGASYQSAGGYRLAPFTRHGNRKLTDAQVRQIRELRAEGHACKRLARRFRVNVGTIDGIVSWKTRKRAGGPVRALPRIIA